MSDPRIRLLKIKTGVVKRLAKEKVAYEKEAANQREWVQKLKDQGEDQCSVVKKKITRGDAVSAKARDTTHITHIACVNSLLLFCILLTVCKINNKNICSYTKT